MVELENKTYRIYDNIFKVDDKNIKFYGNIDFDGILPRLGYGSASTVYKLKIDNKFWALKIFNGLRKEDLGNYNKKLKLDIYSYISPVRLAYFNDEFNGYLMRFCSGKDLEKRRINISIDEFAKSSIKLFSDTDELSLNRYQIYDSYISNVMYDKGFRMIDTDDYPYISEDSIDQIKITNKERLNQLLSDVFIKSAGIANMLFNNVELQKLINSCRDGKITFEELFNRICTLAYNCADEEITNVSEVGKVLRKAKLGRSFIA